ncbi:MAG: type II toxin-antitoxin system Phd/YefM family antitoxin [Candidatus Marinimicrobia bacterium]|nr:type II toxin-antitoxin system Phd/YefM family antitoxin [Candidatus Neomarinimicrobiota bacterium]
MQRIRLDQDIRPLSEFRANVTTFIEEMKRNKRPIVITQHGKSSAVMLGVAEYEQMLEKLELLSDIQAAESQLSAAKGLSHESAKTQVLKDLNA